MVPTPLPRHWYDREGPPRHCLGIQRGRTSGTNLLPVPPARTTALVDPNGNRTSYTLDALGRTVGMLNALGNLTTYDYDADGNQTLRWDARGFRTMYTYDPLHRLGARAYPDGSVNTFSYQPVEIGSGTPISVIACLWPRANSLVAIRSFDIKFAPPGLLQRAATTQWEIAPR